MGQVAFDTQEFVETLENAGIAKEHARAISLAVRKSHEVADVATKADIVEVKHEIAEVNRNISDVRKDMEFRFLKTDAQIAEMRKDLSAEIADVRKDLCAEIADVRKDLSAEIADVRKDLCAEIADVRKDLSAEIASVRKDLSVEIADARKEAAARADKTDAKIALLHKDIESLSNKLIIKMASVMVAIVGVATAIIKLL